MVTVTAEHPGENDTRDLVVLENTEAATRFLDRVIAHTLDTPGTRAVVITTPTENGVDVQHKPIGEQWATTLRYRIIPD